MTTPRDGGEAEVRDDEAEARVVSFAAYRAARTGARHEAAPAIRPAGAARDLSTGQAAHRRRMLAHLLDVAARPARQG